jgi:putative membrane protein
MQRAAVGLVIMLLLLASAAAAHGSGEFHEAEQLIESGASCGELTDGQLELIGDYIMEQMHPGEEHETMDARMGGEGSETLTQAHVSMARRFYCEEKTENGMMGQSGMMGCTMNGCGGDGSSSQGNRYRGMRGAVLASSSEGYGGLRMVLFWGAVILFAVWWITGYARQQKESALDVLKKRYAKGELAKREFERMRKKVQ